MQRRNYFTCDTCKVRRETNVNEHLGFSLKPLWREQGRDTIENAIDRAMNGVGEHLEDAGTCPLCGVQKVGYSQSATIDASPEYLRIHLNLIGQKWDSREQKMKLVKNLNPIQVPDILDITQYMTFQPADQGHLPVRYKLVGSNYHAGPNAKSGHYVAGVTGPKERFQKADGPQYFCNDRNIGDWVDAQGRNVLTANPALNPAENTAVKGSRFNTTTLWYVRMNARCKR